MSFPVYFRAALSPYRYITPSHDLAIPTLYVAAALLYHNHNITTAHILPGKFPHLVIDPHINRYTSLYARRIPYHVETNIPPAAVDLIETIRDTNNKRAIAWGGRRLNPGTPASFIIVSTDLHENQDRLQPALDLYASWVDSITHPTNPDTRGRNIDVRNHD